MPVDSARTSPGIGHWGPQRQSLFRPGAMGTAGKRAVGAPVLLLAAIPALDPIVNQAHTILAISLGPLSMLQAVRGLVFVAMLATVATAVHRGGRAGRTVGATVLAVAVCLVALAANEAFSTDGLVLASQIAYGQIGYWLLMWYLAAASITDDAGANLVLKGLVAGAAITAASVFYGYATGVSSDVYRLEGVAASSGWFVSGKGIAGVLVAGALLAAYRGHRGGRWSMTLVALCCLGASFLTYARAGMVALAASLAWLCIWSLGARLKMSLWARRLIVGSICGAVLVVLAVGTEDLLLRWADIQDPQRAGSGRAMVWKAAVESVLAGTASTHLLGYGLEGMLERIHTAVGVRIHTHNDVLDMLMVGGLVGLLVLALIFAGLLAQIRARPNSPESAVAIGVLIVLCCQGFFTGQLFLPDIMAYYLLSITAVLACGTGDPRHASLAATPAYGGTPTGEGGPAGRLRVAKP